MPHHNQTALTTKIRGKLQDLLRDNPVARYYQDRKRREMLTRSFLESPRYEELFLSRYPDRSRFLEFIHDAEEETENYRFRHAKMGRILGSWRWKGVFQHRSRILPVVFDPDRRGIDFGGAAGPVSPQTDVVDLPRTDVFGREVRYRSCSDLDFRPDYVFSSHTLEHLDDPEDMLRQFRDCLKEDGDLILNLPSYSCRRWRSGRHTHRRYQDHRWTFCLSGTPITESIQDLVAVDELVERHFDIRIREYTGDNSIVVLARPRPRS